MAVLVHLGLMPVFGKGFALVAKKISTTYVDPDGVSSFTASRLIALDKMPDINPIGIGEVACRIVSKTIISVIQNEIKHVAGT